MRKSLTITEFIEEKEISLSDDFFEIFEDRMVFSRKKLESTELGTKRTESEIVKDGMSLFSGKLKSQKFFARNTKTNLEIARAITGLPKLTVEVAEDTLLASRELPTVGDIITYAHNASTGLYLSFVKVKMKHIAIVYAYWHLGELLVYWNWFNHPHRNHINGQLILLSK